MAETSADVMHRQDEGVYVQLTYDHLDVSSVMARVKSPDAGAVVLFAGTTRSTFDSKPVARLSYQSYAPLALATLLALAREVRARHALTAVAVVHRLGPVPVGEESVLVAVSSPHRQAAWRGGEDALELTKERAEIWKLEEFVGDEEGAVWRANRDGKAGVRD
ncbi:putative molybdenum cofactor synthesis protein 2b [Diplodia seriata]|uniref:Molybdopterin synthase catalytic subunit n=1 Tax=Diplodia seriata TaxID=420778 RepID=A0A0G2HKV8_9PEZI|nr:putative molybdenum cofactor synthesis protein 2b [Diplodia seriata]